MVRTIVEHFGSLDVAFCNAGICTNYPAEEMTFEQWKKVIDVNLTGVFLTAQAAGKQMIQQGGRLDYRDRLHVGPYCQCAAATVRV